MNRARWSRIECWVAAERAPDALAAAVPLYARLLGEPAGRWLSTLSPVVAQDGLARPSGPAPQGFLDGAPTDPFALYWTPAAVPELSAPWLELGLVVHVAPVSSEGECTEDHGDSDDGDLEPADRWYEPAAAALLWKAARAFHEALPGAPVFVTDELTEGDAFLSFATEDDEVWDFAAALLPEDWCRRAGRSPPWVERRRFGSTTAFADEAMWVRAPWEED